MIENTAGNIVNAFDFCRRHERRAGSADVADFPRLSLESTARFGEIAWSVEGGTDELGHPAMQLSVAGSVRLICQRCLQPFELALQSEATLLLAKDEAMAEAIEERLEDDSIDVIVGSESCNLLELVEDEALLTLPLSPRHATCPESNASVSVDQVKKESPFSVLKNLKTEK